MELNDENNNIIKVKKEKDKKLGESKLRRTISGKFSDLFPLTDTYMVTKQKDISKKQ